MKINRKILYAASLLSAAHATLTSDVHADMNLSKAMDLTITTNPQVLGDMSSAKARENVIRQKEAGYLPKLDASVSAGYEHTRNKFWTSQCSTGQRCHAERFRSNPSITLIQNVFDGFRTTSDVGKATSDYIQGEKKVDETIEQLSFRAANAYIDVRRFQRLLREAKRNLEAHRSISGKVDQLIKGGRASTADRYTVNARLATAAAAVVDIQGDLDAATADFKALVGVEPDRLLNAKIPNDFLPTCASNAIQIARENNKSVILARASLDVAVAELNGTYASFWPTFNIEAGANRAQNNTGEKGHTDVYNVLGVVRYNLYNGGADVARVSEVTERVSELRYRLDTELRTAEEETRKSWAQKVSSEASAVQLRRSVTALRLERDAFMKQYEIGTRTLIDVLGAINEYFLARGSLITTDAALDTSEARLLASMGVLTKRFGFGRTSPKLLSDTGKNEPMAIPSTDANCKDGNGLYEAPVLKQPETEAVLKNIAAEVPAEKEGSFIDDFMQNLTSSFPSETEAKAAPAEVKKSTTATATAKTAQKADTKSQPVSTKAAATETADSGTIFAPWLAAALYGDESGKTTVEKVVVTPAANISTQANKASAPASETQAQEAVTDQSQSPVSSWFSAVFSGDEAEYKAPDNNPKTSTKNALNDRVVMGSGVTVPAEIKSGQAIK